MVQYSLNICSRRRAEIDRDLESLSFVKSLAHVQQEHRGSLPPEFAVFSQPLAYFEFRLRDRQYSSIGHPPSTTGTRGDPVLPQEVVERLFQLVTTKSTQLADEPGNIEMLAPLLGHLNELVEVRDTGDRAEGDQNGVPFHQACPVHPARRAALAEWQHRLEQLTQSEFDHQSSQVPLFSYPIVDAIPLDNAYLLLFLVSPLDPNFVDENVPSEHRVSEITLALYDVRRKAFPGAYEQLLPLLRNGFSRVLFTSMAEQNSLALTASFGELGTISRYWVRAASDGIRGLLSDEQCKAPFDGFAFCQAIAEKVLCADIPEVTQMEVYPFNRVYIFKEAGVRGIFGGAPDMQDTIQREPIEMQVLEASILSKKPADRGRYLTQRERQIRDTEDFECDASRKIIKPEHSRRFYIHGHPLGLVLSRQATLTESQKADALHPHPSRNADDADRNVYSIGTTRSNTQGGLTTAMYNLLGRLIPEATEKQSFRIPGKNAREVSTWSFTEEFEKGRLKILQRFNKEGLYFDYSHGLDLSNDASILCSLQQAYFEYLDDKLHRQRQQFRQESLAEQNLSKRDIEDVLEWHQNQRARRLRGEKIIDETNAIRGNQTKVVFVSYSARLHEENMRMMLSRDTGDGTEDEALLGSEYTYTMILVADQDSEKSLAQLQAERNDLNLYFQMLMRQIWMDKTNEHEHLTGKSRAIGESLGVFLHRAKALVPDPEKQRELDALFQDLQRLISPTQEKIQHVCFDSSDKLVKTLLPDDSSAQATSEELLRQAVERIMPGAFSDGGKHRLELQLGQIPSLEADWSPVVVRDAFHVALKNACEAACLDKSRPAGRVGVDVQAVPTVADAVHQHWFLDVVIENTGGPIPDATLADLNARTPCALDQNVHKPGSTGVGVFLARYQLHDVIGQGADLIITNAGNGIVRTRVRLPARSDVQRLDEMINAGPLMHPTRDYVLYVEDDETHYGPSIQTLRDLVQEFTAPTSTAMEVVHTRSLGGACKLADKKMPRLVISDVVILSDDASAGLPSKKHGKQLMKSLMERAQRCDKYPPIWILTGDDYQQTKQLFGDLPEGFQLLPEDEEDEEKMAAPGSMCIFGQTKRVDDIPHLPAALKSLLPSNDENSTPEASTSSDLDFVEIPLIGTEFPERLSEAVAEHNTLAGPLFLVHSDANETARLAADLHAWFTHPGIPDLDPCEHELDESYCLYDRVMHKRLVLVVWAGQELYPRLPVSICYWGLSRNIWFAKPGTAQADVAQSWRSLRSEERGPMSTLRHDLTNRWSASAPTAELEALRKRISEIERVLLLDTDLDEQLDAAMRRHENAMTIMENLIVSHVKASNDRQEIRNGLQRLETQLEHCTEKEYVPAAFFQACQRMIGLLRDYIG